MWFIRVDQSEPVAGPWWKAQKKKGERGVLLLRAHPDLRPRPMEFTWIVEKQVQMMIEHDTAFAEIAKQVEAYNPEDELVVVGDLDVDDDTEDSGDKGVFVCRRFPLPKG